MRIMVSDVKVLTVTGMSWNGCVVQWQQRSKGFCVLGSLHWEWWPWKDFTWQGRESQAERTVNRGRKAELIGGKRRGCLFQWVCGWCGSDVGRERRNWWEIDGPDWMILKPIRPFSLNSVLHSEEASLNRGGICNFRMTVLEALEGEWAGGDSN